MLCDWRREYAYIEEESARRSDSALGSEDGDTEARVPSDVSKPIVLEGVEVPCEEGCEGCA
jgi:L-serine/L-threonine ammonia-lyase